MRADKTHRAIDAAIEKQQDGGMRRHLGASIIGSECTRQIWYSYRWAKKIEFDARVLRLFDRGHLEERRFVNWLTNAGIKIKAEADNGKQFTMSKVFGHYGGSCDGFVYGLEEIRDEKCVFECKTHNDASFKNLVKHKVKVANPQHYIQCQQYMLAFGFKYALYCAINKNNDDIYLEIITYQPSVAKKHIARAGYIIFSDEAPPRISDKPRWYKCLMCDYHAICHKQELPHINCRTCAHSSPEKKGDKGLWSCQLKQNEIYIQPKQGCEEHVYNPHMLNGVEMLSGNLKENWLKLRIGEKTFKHGPRHIKQEDVYKTEDAF